MSERHLFPDRRFDGFLFDMDGTVLTSIIAAERVWGEWGHKHGLDVAELLRTLHGVRTIETVKRQNIPGIDPEAEAQWIIDRELEDTDGIDEIPDARRFLNSLPADRWALVTSASRALAERRLKIAGLPTPPIFITAEDVTRGKPAPDPFLLGAQKLGMDAKNCVVFEDAPAGIAAGEAAGAAVVVITHTHTHEVETRWPRVPGYGDLKARQEADGRLSLFSEA